MATCCWRVKFQNVDTGWAAACLLIFSLVPRLQILIVLFLKQLGSEQWLLSHLASIACDGLCQFVPVKHQAEEIPLYFLGKHTQIIFLTFYKNVWSHCKIFHFFLVSKQLHSSFSFSPPPCFYIEEEHLSVIFVDISSTNYMHILTDFIT